MPVLLGRSHEIQQAAAELQISLEGAHIVIRQPRRGGRTMSTSSTACGSAGV